MKNYLVIIRVRLHVWLDALLRHRSNKVAHFAHKFENHLHVAYLGGVAFGGGYRYAAIGMLVCILLVWIFSEGE